MARQASAAGLARGAAIAFAMLGGCTATPPPPAGLIAAPAPPVEPRPPAGAPADMTIPSKDPLGRYRTINLGIGPAATVWHLRSALNVAALSCRGPQEATLTADYNRLLSGKRALLAAAYARTEADARAAGGKAWRDAHDRHMTRLYNYFALPPAKPAFCAAAVQVAAEAAAMAPAGFQAFAEPALRRLEAPFLDFYARYDAYRARLALWRARITPSAALPGTPAPATIG